MVKMEHLLIELNDLPDEILLTIFKKLNNISLLYSLICVNKRLNTIIRDPIFTNHLTLMRYSSDDSACSLSSSILDRFCLQILPEIHNQIKWLDLESSSMERILLAADYPNLCQLGIFNLDIEIAVSLFLDECSLIHRNKNQISALTIDITKCKNQSPVKHMNISVFTSIFIVYTNLQYFNFGSSSIWYQKLSFPTSPPTFTSSNLLQLHVSLGNFNDCLYILDGRFNQLHTFHVNIGTIRSSCVNINNKEKLPNLKCFSLHCNMITDTYDKLILPLLYRMSNLEKLDLNLYLSVEKTFIDGNDLKKNIIDHIPQLDKFTFNIQSILHFDNQIDFPSNEDIQNTFNDFQNKHIISCVNYFQEKQYSHCHIYTYPYQLKYYNRITNHFSGGLFKCVREILLYDEHPFEHEFFLRIQESFPFVKKLSIHNFKPQNKNLYRESNNDNQDLPIIEYPYLTNLSLNKAHDDYLEQFLDDTKIRLSNNVHLNINYQSMKRVTHSFTRNTTRINCAKLKSLCLNISRISKYVRNYFPYTEIS